VALALERQGKVPDALAALASAHEPPGSASSGRVLYERARITDEHLRDPLSAAKLYGDYVAAFPQGPYARLSADRQQYLVRNGTPAPQALAEYEAILGEFARHPSAQLVPRMSQVIDRYPAFPLRPRACFWLANILRQRQDFDGAAHWLGVVLHDYPGTGDAHRADISLAQDAVSQHQFAAAMSTFERYVDSDDPLARELARAQLRVARNLRLWFWLFRGGLVLLGGWLAALTLGILRRHAPFWPLPFEARLFGPIAVVMALLTFVESRRVGVAVSIIAGGGVLLATLQGVYLRASAPRGLRRLVHVLVSAGAAASLAFCAIDACGLTDLVITTIEQGADR